MLDLSVFKLSNLLPLVTLEATVSTGLENVAFNECKTKCKPEEIIKSPGRIFFSIQQPLFDEAKKLRSIDNINQVIHYFQLQFTNEKTNDLMLVKNLVDKIHWKFFLDQWSLIKSYKGDIFLGGEIPFKYRVTCYRTGTHSFSSPEAAREFGGFLNDKFNWKVDLTKFDLEVILNVVNDTGYVALRITDESLHRRNITYFSNLTLRSTICYCLLNLAQPKKGDVIIDPLCGSGSIPIEGALAYPETFCFGGDINESVIEKSKKNIDLLHRNIYAQGALSRSESSNLNLKSDVLRWSADALPLKDSSVDIYVTDLPFGKKSGNKKYNRILYNKLLCEAARILRPSTGRAVMLTADKGSFVQALNRNHSLWKQTNHISINQGGLRASVFLLLRTSTLFLKQS